TRPYERAVPSITRDKGVRVPLSQQGTCPEIHGVAGDACDDEIAIRGFFEIGAAFVSRAPENRRPPLLSVRVERAHKAASAASVNRALIELGRALEPAARERAPVIRDEHRINEHVPPTHGPCPGEIAMFRSTEDRDETEILRARSSRQRAFTEV